MGVISNSKLRLVAVWLIDNTSLTFDQIKDFCNMDLIDIEMLADDTSSNNKGEDPVMLEILTREEIERCSNDENARLEYKKIDGYISIKDEKIGVKSQSRIHRKSKPDGIMWLLKYHEYLSDYQIAKLVGSNNNTVKSIRNKNYSNYKLLQAKNPVDLGLCEEDVLQKVIERHSKEAQ